MKPKFSTVIPTPDKLISLFNAFLPFLVAQTRNGCWIKAIPYLYFYLCFLASVIFPFPSSNSVINNGMTHYRPTCIIREPPSQLQRP